MLYANNFVYEYIFVLYITRHSIKNTQHRVTLRVFFD
jgi:hypothetical protein